MPLNVLNVLWSFQDPHLINVTSVDGMVNILNPDQTYLSVAV